MPSKNINKKTSNNNNSKQTQSEDFLKLYKEYKTQNPDSQSEDFLKFWNGYQESQLEKLRANIHFDMSNYINSLDVGRRRNKGLKKYTKEDVMLFLRNPDNYEAALRQISNYLYNMCQEYKNLIKHYSKMLTFDNILLPDIVNPKVYEDKKKLLNSFYKNLQFIQDYNIKYKLGKVTDILVREDVYFAYEKTDGENFVWHQLPSNYCRIKGMDKYECYKFEFDFSYFNKRDVDINNYPIEFRNKYNNYQIRKANRWQEISIENGICFKFDESVMFGLPHFAGLFDELFRLEDIKELNEINNKVDNFKLIHQKIPMKTDSNAKPHEFLIDDKFATGFHNNVKSNVPDGIGVATTPMELTPITLKRQDSHVEDIVSKELHNLMSGAGVSQILFNSDGAVGLNRNLENTSTYMFPLLRQYATFFKKRLKMFNGKTYRWKIDFLYTTWYNQKDKIDQYLKNAQYGYNKFFVSASLGIDQGNMLGLTELENALDLTDKMKPLSSSHTQNGDENTNHRPQKSENDLQDSGVRTRDDESNIR